MTHGHDTQNQRQIPTQIGKVVIETVYSNGAYHLATLDGSILIMLVNGKLLKKYQP